VDEQVENLLMRWERQLAWKEKAHIETSRWLWRKNSWIGYPAAGLAAIVGTSVFVGLLEENARSGLGAMVVVVLSLAAAVLSVVQAQTRTNFLEQSEKHRLASANYGNLKREIELVKASPEMTDDESRKRAREIKVRFDKLDAEAPRIPKYASKWKRAGKPPAGIPY
jgi:hypothetical protein